MKNISNNIILVAPGNSIHSQRWFDNFKEKYLINWISLHKFELMDPDPKIKYISSRWYSLFISPIKIFRICNEDNVKIIHIHSIARYALFSALAIFFTNKKIILSPWGSDLIYGSQKFFWRIFIKKLFRRAILIIVDAQHMIDLCKKVYPASNVIQINFGTDTKEFCPLISRESKNYFTILSVRNHESIYNIDNIIKAFSSIVKKYENSKLVILGYGTLTDELKSLVLNIDLDHCVTFTGRVNKEEMINNIRNCDIAVSASNSDAGLSASLAEAMSCGKVVLASESGSENHLWITNSINGFLFDHNSVDDLVDKIQTCIANKERLNSMGFKSRKVIVERNNSVEEMTKVARIYKSFSVKK